MNIYDLSTFILSADYHGAEEITLYNAETDTYQSFPLWRRSPGFGPFVVDYEWPEMDVITISGSGVYLQLPLLEFVLEGLAAHPDDAWWYATTQRLYLFHATPYGVANAIDTIKQEGPGPCQAPLLTNYGVVYQAGDLAKAALRAAIHRADLVIAAPSEQRGWVVDVHCPSQAAVFADLLHRINGEVKLATPLKMAEWVLGW